MTRVGIRMCLVAVSLTRLCEQNQRCGVGCLKAECKIEKNERIDVELGPTQDVYGHPAQHDHRLCNQESWGAKKAGEGFSLQREPIEDPTFAIGLLKLPLLLVIAVLGPVGAWLMYRARRNPRAPADGERQ